MLTLACNHGQGIDHSSSLIIIVRNVKGFNCESITFYSFINIFECMKIAESIYESVVETSYKNLPGKIPTVLVTSEK